MNLVQDTIAVISAAAAMLLLAILPLGTVTAQQQEQQQRPPSASVRAICKDDIAKFCAGASGAQKVKACMQDNARQLNQHCRSALQLAGMLAK